MTFSSKLVDDCSEVFTCRACPFTFKIGDAQEGTREELIELLGPHSCMILHKRYGVTGAACGDMDPARQSTPWDERVTCPECKRLTK